MPTVQLVLNWIRQPLTKRVNQLESVQLVSLISLSSFTFLSPILTFFQGSFFFCPSLGVPRDALC